MRIAVYNQMFGLNGRSFFKNFLGHYYLHYQKNPEKVFSRANLNFTFEIIKKSEADIVGICEIYEGQENEIKQGLKKLGYEHFYFGQGHRFKFNNRHVIELIASKIKGTQLEHKMWPVENRLGGEAALLFLNFRDLMYSMFILLCLLEISSKIKLTICRKFLVILKIKLSLWGTLIIGGEICKNIFLILN